MELLTRSKRPGMNGAIDIFYEQGDGFSEYLNDPTTYKIVMLDRGSFAVEENGQYRVFTAPVAISLNEKADFKVISQSNVRSRTIFFRPTVIRKEFTIDAINSGKYYKYWDNIAKKDGMTFDEKMSQLINGENAFGESFTQDLLNQDALLLLWYYTYEQDIVYISITSQEDDQLRRLFCSVRYDLWEQPDNYWILRARYFLISILFMAVADFYRYWRQDEIYKDPLVAKVTLYFWDHLSEEITLPVLLKQFSVNKNTLNDAFNKEVDMSCMMYLERLRVSFAKKLLQYESYPISEVSVMCGYQDTNYFSRVFKKHMGMTPTEFLKNFRETNK